MKKIVTSQPYLRDVFTIKQYGKNIVKISYVKCLRESGWELDEPKSPKASVNETKLSNNLSRTKATVRELVLCNDWNFWCTFTISPDKYDRYDLKRFFHDFAEFLHNYNRRCSNTEKVLYLLIPEQHEDGAWHLHGFIKGIRSKDLYINEFGYLTWKQYEKKFGFISMSPVKDKERASSYILKYMTKDTDKSISELNAHSFYASHGLNRSVEKYRGSGDFKGSWDWEHPDGYCKIKTIDTRIESLEEYFDISITEPHILTDDFLRPIVDPFSGFKPHYSMETGEIYLTPFDDIPLIGGFGHG